MNYFPFHLGDYAAHTGHLEPMEDLAYRRLLDQYYLRECPLPADIEATAKLVRMRSMKSDVEAVLREFFVLTDAGWQHARCDAEIEKMQDKQAKARASGIASANARKSYAERARQAKPTDAEEKSTNAERSLGDLPTDVQLPTPTPTPISVTDVTDGTPSKKITDPDEIIFGYGVPLLVNAGTADKQARSFLGGLRKQHGDQALIDTLRQCVQAKPLQPLEWLAAALPPPTGRAASRKSGKPSLYEHNQAAAQEAMRLLNEGVM